MILNVLHGGTIKTNHQFECWGFDSEFQENLTAKTPPLNRLKKG